MTPLVIESITNEKRISQEDLVENVCVLKTTLVSLE